MARIRTIKPEFWRSEQVTDCSTNARLLFIGLWNFCDDNGVLPAKPKQIKAEVFPADDISSENISRMLDELEAVGLIGYFEHEEEQYLYVTGWKKHQKVDRPSYKHPEPPKERTRRRQQSLNLRRAIDERHPPEGKGREGKGREEEGDSTSASPNAPSPPQAGDLADAIVEAFDRSRVKHYGEDQARPHRHSLDLVMAKRWIEAGADLALCTSVFEAVHAKVRERSGDRPKIHTLQAFDDDIAHAIAAAKKPLPAGDAQQAEARTLTAAEMTPRHWRLKLDDWTKRHRANPDRWTGPGAAPGLKDCLCPPEIQREFGIVPFGEEAA